MKVSFLKSLRFRMPLLVLSGILPLMSIAILVATAKASKTILQESQENLVLKAELLAKNISSWDESNVLALLNLNKQPDIISGNIQYLSKGAYSKSIGTHSAVQAFFQTTKPLKFLIINF